VWARFGLSIVLWLLTACLFLSALVFTPAGSRTAAAVAEAVDGGASSAAIWTVLQWVVVVACAFLGFALTDFVAPDVNKTEGW
jgi:uncharacterized BrkB/YihY/UPF0761 family membrane protein